MADYKAAKEAWVSGLHGSELLDVALVGLAVPFGALVHRVVSGLTVARLGPSRSGLLGDVLFMAVLLAALLDVPALAPRAVALAAAGVVALALALPWLAPRGSAIQVSSSKAGQREQVGAVSRYRAAMMACTALAIVAVDFAAFPRRFAKTETYGHSVMDAGVGCFMFSAGIVARHVGSAASVAQQLQRAVRSALPLLVLGAARLVTTKAAQYQEHVSEYGVHWNFFFTLGAVQLLLVLLRPPTAWSAAAALAIAGAYQAALSLLGLAEYIEHAPRETLLSMNKEGVCSSLGYVAIYLLGVQLGHVLLRPRSVRQWRSLLVPMALLDAALWLATNLLHHYVAPNSRRMANLTYVVFVAAYNLFALTGLLAIDAFLPQYGSELLVTAINRNGLAVFLVANLTTGLINLSMQTIYASTAVAVTVLLAYGTWVCLFAVALHKLDITLKL